MRHRLKGLWNTWRYRVGASAGWVALIDGICLVAALSICWYWRLGGRFNGQGQTLAMQTVVLLVCVLGAFGLLGCYRVYWPSASLEEVFLLGRGYLYGWLTFFALQFFVPVLTQLPRSAALGACLISWFMMLFFRLTWRLTLIPKEELPRERMLIVGAGEAASILTRDMVRQGIRASLVGMVDDDPLKQGKSVAGLKVLGTLADIEVLVERWDCDSAVLAAPSMDHQRRVEVYHRLTDLGLKVRVLPGLVAMADGTVSAGKLKELRLEDLLARDPITVDISSIEQLVRGRTVLVTGAGGSIGSEIVRQVLRYKPRTVVLLGHGEHSIYTLLEELALGRWNTRFVPVIADVADGETMRRVFETHKPGLVFHAAAHKHVPLMEDNPHEAVRVNDLGTYTVGDLAGEFGVDRMVLISTDKAVNPTSVMGATKRVAELTVLGLQARYPNTRYMAVRFGNVLGSRGSVIPKFEEQISRGGPVTVTHPDMERYFMLIPEAASLVVQSAAIGEGGNIFVLDMGRSVKIVDLARTMIKLHGFEPDVDIKIQFSGCRPGEKLFEELFYDEAHVDRTSHPKIFQARIDDGTHRDCTPRERVDYLLNAADTRAALMETVPEYVGKGYEG